MFPAIAGRSGTLLIEGPGDGIVPPFSGDPMSPLEDSTVNNDAGASAGADDHAKHRTGAFRSAVDRFGQCETVRVIAHSHWAAQRQLEIAIHRMANQPDGIRVLHHAGLFRNRPRNTDTDAPL